MNYIIHLNATFQKFCEDDRLTPFHISLYFGLFQYWNIAKFRNPISISRDELMRAAKIGSVNTYIRCIKELDKWEYIQYKPSFNPQRGSQVHLYTFNKTTDNATDISNNKGTGKAGNKADETQVIPSTNNTNKLNSNKPSKEEVKQFFDEKKFPPIEAQKFFNSYQAKGWKMGATQIQDWRAAAENWMLNTGKFNNESKTTKPGKLHANNSKNYGEPL